MSFKTTQRRRNYEACLKASLNSAISKIEAKNHSPMQFCPQCNDKIKRCVTHTHMHARIDTLTRAYTCIHTYTQTHGRIFCVQVNALGGIHAHMQTTSVYALTHKRKLEGHAARSSTPSFLRANAVAPRTALVVHWPLVVYIFFFL